jgi:AraC family transcriptional regulator of arabinose operon
VRLRIYSAYRLLDATSLIIDRASQWLQCCACATHVLRTSERGPRVESAEKYLCQHLSENVRLDQLAEAGGLSVSRLSKLFKKQTGMTPQQYCEQQRLERARQWLE